MRAVLSALTATGLVIGFILAAPSSATERDKAGVVVAVLDTGITAHPETGWRVTNRGVGRPGGVVLPGYDFVSDPWVAADGDGWDPDPSDRGDGVKPREAADRAGCRSRVSSWHGTNVAGTIAAQGFARNGSLGIAPSARILPVRIMGRCGGNTADVAAGLLWAAGEPIPDVPLNPYPAKIINVSLSGTASRCPRPLQTAIDVARERGAIVVAAAGSSAQNTATSTPANCAGVITVAAVDKKGKRAPTSNFGSEVTLSALGGDMSTGERNGVLTTTDTGRYRPRDPAFGYYQGSSAAAARVSGALAALATRNPRADADTMTSLLLSAAAPFDSGQCDAGEGNCGAGILDLESLLDG